MLYDTNILKQSSPSLPMDTNQKHLSHEDEGVPKKLDHTQKVVALIVVAILAVGFSIYIQNNLYRYVSSQKTSPMSNPSVEKTKQTSSYKHDYWGFAASYPDEWFAWESSNGNIFYFESYDGKEKDVWYTPLPSELRIGVFVIDKDTGPDYKATALDDIVKEAEGPLIDGEKSKVIYSKSALSHYEKGRQQSFGIPQSHIDRGHYLIKYITQHNGFTYVISAEPADSDLISELDEFVANFRFIKRIEYLPRSDQPAAGFTYYEDLLIGYTFEHPIDAPFRSCQDIPCGAIDRYSIGLDQASLAYLDSGSFETDIKTYAAAYCAADGPNGSQFCPEEEIMIEEFINKNNVKGYKIYRQKVNERYSDQGTTTTVTDDIVIAYPVDHPEYFAVTFNVDNPSTENIDKLLEIAGTFKYLDRKP